MGTTTSQFRNVVLSSRYENAIDDLATIFESYGMEVDRGYTLDSCDCKRYTLAVSRVNDDQKNQILDSAKSASSVYLDLNVTVVNSSIELWDGKF